MKLFKSKHFGQLWDRVICPSIDSALENMDEEFKISCMVQRKPSDSLKDKIERRYRALRRYLKEKCYGSQDGSLDNRKLGAIFSRVLIEEKPLIFDLQKAYEFAYKKKEQLDHGAYNEWVVNNVLVNYKIAYIAGAHLVYFGLMEQWSADESKEKHLFKLNERGALNSYPTSPEFDSFGQNMVIALARADSDEQDLDMLLFGLQLYQQENYTRALTEFSVFLDQLEAHPENAKELIKQGRNILSTL